MNQTDLVSILDLERECAEFIESVKIVQRSCDTGSLSDTDLFHPEDRSLKLILSFVNEAQKKAKNLSGLFEATIKTEFEGVLRYFGEDPLDKSARASFFRRFVDFMTQYQIAKKENLAREETKKKEEARKRILGTSPSRNGAPRDPKTMEANNKIMDDLLDKLRAAPKDSTRHQRRRAARRVASGPKSILRSASSTSEDGLAPPPPVPEMPSSPSVADVALPAGDDGEEMDLGKVAQGLLAGLKGGDDLLASFREATRSANAGMNKRESKPEEEVPQSAESQEENDE